MLKSRYTIRNKKDQIKRYYGENKNIKRFATPKSMEKPWKI